MSSLLNLSSWEARRPRPNLHMNVRAGRNKMFLLLSPAVEYGNRRRCPYIKKELGYAYTQSSISTSQH